MQIVIRGRELPGRRWVQCDGADRDHQNIVVGLGLGTAVVDAVPGDALAPAWTVDVRVVRGDNSAHDFRGPLVHGRPGDRFLYLSWGDVDALGVGFTMFRRAKIGLNAIPSDLVARAGRDEATLSCSVRLTDAGGGPRCVRIAPEELDWSLDG